MGKSTRTTDWLLTQHAVERYIERFEPTATHGEAKRTLMGALASAKRLKTNTLRGHYRWVLPELHGGVVVIVKEDKRRVVVTVEPLHDLDRNFESDWREIANQLYIKDEEFREAERLKYRDTKKPKDVTKLVEPTNSAVAPAKRTNMDVTARVSVATATVTRNDPTLELERLRGQRARDERKLAELTLAESMRKRKHELQLVDRYANESLLKAALVYMVTHVAQCDEPEDILAEFVKAYPDFAKMREIKSVLDAIGIEE